MTDPIVKPALTPARRAGALLFLSGQLPRETDGNIHRGSIEQQTARVIDNIETLLAANGLALGDVVKTTVWLSRADFTQGFNAVYAERFAVPYPARSTVVSALVAPADIEIEAIALFPSGDPASAIA